MKDFTKPILQSLLDIKQKNRSNLFSWRGQFSPQLIECLLSEYCIPGSVVLDPFVGSGTVLYESAAMSLTAFGFEINPSAWSFSKVYEFANMEPSMREAVITEFQSKIDGEFPNEAVPVDTVEERVSRIGLSIGDEAKVLCNALVVLLDLGLLEITNTLVQSKFMALAEMVRRLPYSDKPIRVGLNDARLLPLHNECVDFTVTSPPYINVFNYHQNYRRSVEVLGWDVLRTARSEIGSNRANRGNRFCTVVQYCIDMAAALQEVSRVLKQDGRAVFVVGYESKVLGCPFYNSDIIERLAILYGFDLVLRQKRTFKNRFGDIIREDILNLRRDSFSVERPVLVGRAVARESLSKAMGSVADKNRAFLMDAISRVDSIEGTPILKTGV